MSIERLAGPATHVCWTPDSTPRTKRFAVSLVRESDLEELERRAELAQAAIVAIDALRKES